MQCLLSMKRYCPKCPHQHSEIRKHGFFKRKSDYKTIQRFKCIRCNTTFSKASTQKCINQNKRHLNSIILKLIASKNSQRRIALLLGISKNTVASKIQFLARMAREKNRQMLKQSSSIQEIIFDDMETFEHSKMKPLSITVVVEKYTQKILGARASIMPAKGLLAKRSRKKYGRRKDQRHKSRERLFQDIKNTVGSQVTIESDQNPHYIKSVTRHFPEADYIQYRGRRGCVVGQGELKEGGFDPLFYLNHTCAMIRDNLGCLVRRTWCTSKTIHHLQDRLDIYTYFHNNFLLKSRRKVALS